MNKADVLPQFGIITAVNSGAYEAKVFLPLYKMETEYIKIAKNIPLKQQKISVTVEGISVGGTAAEYTDGSQAMVVYKEGLENGSQVVVSFMNGSLENAVITALL